eukprot:g9555.t1
MLLTSTFPDLSEDEALRELNPSSGGGSGANPPSTPPPLPVRYGRLAGWISGLADTTSVGTRRSYSDRDPRPSSTAADRGFCPNGDGAAPTTTVPANSSSIQPVSSQTPMVENNGGGTHKEGASAAASSSSNGGAAATATVGNHGAATQPPKRNNATTPPLPISNHYEHGHRLCSGDSSGGGGGSGGGSCSGGEGSARISSPTEPPLSVAGEDSGPAMTASRAVRRGDVVAVERPLAAAQSSQTLPWVAACPGCLRHVGSLEAQLAIASGERDRAEAFRPEAGTAVAEAAAEGTSSTSPEPEAPGAAACFRRSAESPREDGEGDGGNHGCGLSCEGGKGARLPPLEGLSERFLQPAFPCSAGCGAIYCSEDCRRRCWERGGHSVLCLGLVADEAHPLVQHKVHALDHPELEAPLLLAAALIVQAAQAVALARLRRCKAAAISSPAPGPTSLSYCFAQAPVASAAAAAAAAAATLSERKLSADGGCDVGIANGPAAPAAGGAADCPAPSCWPRGLDDEEEAVTRDMMDGLFPRGWLRNLPPYEEEGRKDERGSVAAVEESWALLTQAVEARVGPSLAGAADSQLGAGADSDAVAVVDPRDFPLLLSRRVHERVVGGLAANLMEVEVESPLVEYCEALVTQEAEVQQRALQVLEPALAAMEQRDEEDEGGEGLWDDNKTPEEEADELDGHGNDNTPNSDMEHSSAETTTDCTSDPDAGDPDAGTDERRTENFLENCSYGGRDRSRERLAWRCVEAACAAASLIPPLTAHVLLPAAALRLPHSCAPAIRVPAGDRRSYNACGGGGLAGRPLTVAMVALRDITAGAPLSCAWVDAREPFTARMSKLEEYCRVGVVPPASAGPGGTEGSREVGGAVVCGGCGCPKCFVESHDVGGCSEDEASSDLAVECLLEAARQAVDEDRFDDAFDALRRAARAAPDSAEVLYRSGVCAINQGRWSRALRLWRDGLALSPEHRDLKQEAEKYRALAFWLDGHCRGGEQGGANETGSADNAPPAFSAPPPRNDRETDLVEQEGGGGGEVAAASADSVAGHEPSAASAATQQFTENLDVEFMAGDGEWVCKTRVPPLSASECAAVVAEAEEKAAAAAAAAGGGEDSSSGWGTARHYAVPTTDVAVRELPRTLTWFNAAMRTRIGPIVAAAASLGDGIFPEPHRQRRRRRQVQGFPPEPGAHGQEAHRAASTRTPVDAGSGAGPDDGDDDCDRNSVDDDEDEDDNDDAADIGDEHDEGSSSSACGFLRALRVHDAFVVRYDAAAQRSLPLHTDQGELSLTISLNGAEEYEGGGTWFEGLGRAVRPQEAGHVVVFPGGSTVHGGREVTSGIRYILAVFLYVHREEEEEEEGGE